MPAAEAAGLGLPHLCRDCREKPHERVAETSEAIGVSGGKWIIDKNECVEVALSGGCIECRIPPKGAFSVREEDVRSDPIAHRETN